MNKESSQNEDSFELITARTRPFFSYQDSAEVKRGEYEKVGRRLKKRAAIFFIIATICAVFFVLNGFFNLFTYFEQARIFDLILGILWIFIGLLSAYSAVKYSSRLRNISEVLLNRARETAND